MQGIPQLFGIALLIGLIGPAANVQAQKSPEKPAAPAKSKLVDAVREAELLSFVREHHSELAALLEQLKPQETAKYQAALADLDRDFKRLEQLRKKAPKEYEHELNLWKSRSRVRLLAARLSMTDDTGLRDELKGALRDLRQHELASLEREIAGVKTGIEKHQQRLDKLERQQVKLTANEEQWVDQQLNALEQDQKSKADKPVKAGKSKQKAPVEAKVDTK